MGSDRERKSADRSETDTSDKNTLVANDGTVLATFKMATVAEGNTGFVSGGDLWNETRADINSTNYISQNATAGANLAALDRTIGAKTTGNYYLSTDDVETQIYKVDAALATASKIVRLNENENTILVGRNTTNGTEYGKVKTIDVSNVDTTGNTVYRTITGVAYGGNDPSLHDAAAYGQIAKTGQTVTIGATTTNKQILANDNTELVNFEVTEGIITGGNTGFISGGTAYSYLSPTADGNYIKTGASQTTAQNLAALDAAIGKVTNDGHYITAQNGTTVNVATNLTELDNALYEHSKLVTSDKTTTSAATQIFIGNDADFNGVTDISVATLGKATRTISGVGYGTDNHNAAAVGQLIAGGQYSASSSSDANAQSVTLDYIGNDNTATKVSIKIAGEGKVQEGDKRLVDGGTVYEAFQDAIYQGTYKDSDTISIEKENGDDQYTVRVRNMAMSQRYDSTVTASPVATGMNAVALGMGGTATGNYAQAFGTEAKATGNWAIAIGKGAEATWTARRPSVSKRKRPGKTRWRSAATRRPPVRTAWPSGHKRRRADWVPLLSADRAKPPWIMLPRWAHKVKRPVRNLLPSVTTVTRKAPLLSRWVL